MAKTKTQETVKPYAFRKLSATDVFPMFTIMSKIGINTFADSFNAKELMKGANEQDASIVGISVALNIAQKIMSIQNPLLRTLDCQLRELQLHQQS